MSSILGLIRPKADQESRDTPEPPPQAAAPARPATAAECSVCGSRSFWRDPYGVLRCDSCSPPKVPAMVRSMVTILPDGSVKELTRAASEKLPDALLPPAGYCKKCGHPRFRAFEEKIFCEKCEKNIQPTDSEGRLLHVRSCRGGSPLFWEPVGSFAGSLVFDVLFPEERDYFDALRLKEMRAAAAADSANHPAGKADAKRPRGRRS